MVESRIFEFLLSLFQLVVFGLGIYGFVLFVKLCNRGIKAFDIYIAEKTNKDR